MRNPKLFLLFVLIFTIFFFLVDLPKNLTLGNLKVPGNWGKTPLGISELSINLGPLQLQKEFDYKLGLDLQGGTKLVYRINMSGIPTDQRQNAFDSARNVIDRRINFFGVSEPLIQTLKIGGDYRVTIELPGMTDVSRATDLIGQTAQLTFWEGNPTASSSATNIATPSANIPQGLELVLGASPIKTKLTGKDLKSAKPVFDSNTGKPQVQLEFSTEGNKLFADITKRNVGKVVAIALDNQVIEAPRVEQPILSGNAVITGNFTTQSAKDLSIALNAGALPAPLELIAQSTVGPSLGMDSLHKSLFAGFIGLISIAIFMIYLYRKEGILASIALLIYSIAVLFIFKLIAVTLTLAGIAGFILSIGMAVDANILIFERMKEEKRAGKDRDIAIRLGFLRAWPSIRDSNISSIITCFILIYFGSGMVRGFALTLLIGILVSMFSAILITRNLLWVFDRQKK